MVVITNQSKNSENKFYHFLDNIHIGLETVEFV